MSKRNLWISASVAFGFALLVQAGLLEEILSATTQADEDQLAVLEGLTGVSVEVVQPVSGFEDKPTFNPVKLDELQATVERLLTQSRIHVFDDTSDDPQIGRVVVTVNVWKGKISINFIVQVKAELYQQATLVRDAGVQMLIPTWPLGEKALEAPMPVIVTRHEIARTVQDEMETQVKTLIADYLEANPRAEPKPDISGMMTGTILYTNVEGSYNIFADNGVEYHPVNLPPQYRRHRLRVAFRGRQTTRGGIPFPGVWIELIRIVRLKGNLNAYPTSDD